MSNQFICDSVIHSLGRVADRVVVATGYNSPEGVPTTEMIALDFGKKLIVPDVSPPLGIVPERGVTFHVRCTDPENVNMIRIRVAESLYHMGAHVTLIMKHFSPDGAMVVEKIVSSPGVPPENVHPPVITDRTPHDGVACHVYETPATASLVVLPVAVPIAPAAPSTQGKNRKRIFAHYGAVPSSRGKERKCISAHFGAVTFLSEVITGRSGVRNPRNPAEFLTFVRKLANPSTSKKNHSFDPFDRLLLVCNTDRKSVLRQITAMVLPLRKSKKIMIHETLGLPHVAIAERSWTIENCVEILTKVCEVCPHLAVFSVHV